MKDGRRLDESFGIETPEIAYRCLDPDCPKYPHTWREKQGDELPGVCSESNTKGEPV